MLNIKIPLINCRLYVPLFLHLRLFTLYTSLNFIFKTCKSLVREENIAFDNDFAELKNLGKENMARSHTKHMTEIRVLTSALLQQLNFTVLPIFFNFFYLASLEQLLP